MEKHKHTDEVELVQGEDGVYVEKSQRRLPQTKQKVKQHKNIESFLDGVDKGFDFLESVGERLDRFLKLKK